jgi:hypothetical protein
MRSLGRKPLNMGIAELEPRQLAPTVGTTGSGSTGSSAPSSSSTTSPARLHLASSSTSTSHLHQRARLHHQQRWPDCIWAFPSYPAGSSLRSANCGLCLATAKSTRRRPRVIHKTAVVFHRGLGGLSVRHASLEQTGVNINRRGRILEDSDLTSRYIAAAQSCLDLVRHVRTG